ncbi:hypothetical protein [Vibrio sp. HN007]|uniref:hypothetical protein n=1 Tax=Vibrio iocasae TaxID=3098914 RepID=UPI0035D46FA3
MKSMMILSLLCLLTACGGGGDSGDTSTPETAPDSSPDNASDSTPDSGVSPDALAEVSSVTMEELVIPDGFSFDTLETRILTVDLSEYSGERSFISLYAEYDSSTLKPVYRSKIITAELVGGETTISFTLNDDELPIVAEVYGLTSRTASQKLITFASNSELWQE